MDGGSVYGLEHQARCLKAQLAEQERSRFFVGTQDLKHQNELHLVDFDEDESLITSHKFSHAHEMWDIAPSPSRADLVITVYREASEPTTACLWRFETPEADDAGRLKNDAGKLEQLSVVDASGKLQEIRAVLWDPAGTNESAVALSNHALGVLSFDGGSSRTSPTTVISVGGEDVDACGRATCASWNPHGIDVVATGIGRSVYGWDLRTAKQSFSMKNAHSAFIKDVDYNPNKPYNLATGGDDCKIRFWDTRNCNVPLKEISDHSHWIWSISFNRFHDQLFLSSGSDCQVNLQSIISISSAPLSDDSSGAEERTDEADNDTDDDFDDYTSKPTDGLVLVYDQHEDSVYAVEWSAADPWIFASLSYDGRLAVNMVPKEHKYKIIL